MLLDKEAEKPFKQVPPPWWKVGEVIADILSLHLVVQIPAEKFNQKSEFGIMKKLWRRMCASFF